MPKIFNTKVIFGHGILQDPAGAGAGFPDKKTFRSQIQKTSGRLFEYVAFPADGNEALVGIGDMAV